jgi:NAD(P)-dependent dehydrogenase (short-subunit alcohol dehydrogenase family)
MNRVDLDGLAGTGIRVNCVTPAAARADIFAQMREGARCAESFQ